MSTIKRGMEVSSTLEEATNTFRFLIGRALKNSVFPDWEPQGGHVGCPDPTLIMRTRRHSFSRIIPAMYASVAYSSLTVNGSWAPGIVCGEAPGKAFERLRVSQMDFAPYVPGFEQRVGTLLERRYLIRLHTEAWERPAFINPRPLTEQEQLDFEPYGGAEYQISLAREHAVATEYSLREDESALYLSRVQSDELKSDISSQLTTDDDAPRLAELNRIMYDAMISWR